MYISKNLVNRRFDMVKSLRLVCVSFIGLLLLFLTCIAFINYGVPLYSSLNDARWVEKQLAKQIQQPVHIGEITTHWQGLQPVVEVNDFSINDFQNIPKLHVKKLKIGIDLLATFLHRKIIPGDLFVDGTHLILRERSNGLIDINDVPILQADIHSLNSKKLEYLLDCFLTKGKKTLKNVDITWLDQKGTIVLPISHLNLKEESQFWFRDFSGEAKIWDHTPLVFRGNSYGNFLVKTLHYSKTHIVVNNVPLQNNSLANRFVKHFSVQQGLANFDLNLALSPRHSFTLNGIFQLANAYLETKNNFMKTHFLLKHRINKWMIKIDTLPVQDVSNFIIENQLVSPRFIELLKKLTPFGDILGLTFERNTHNQDRKITAYLKGINFSQWQRFPGLQNLTGELEVKSKQGSFRLDSVSTFQYQPMFRYAIPINKAVGQIYWNEDLDHSWQVHFKNLHLSTKDGNADGYMHVIIPKNNSEPNIDSKINFNILDVSQTPSYLPVSIMPANVVKWLDGAIKGGVIKNGSFLMRGNMQDFPFDNGKGKFLIQGDLVKGQLHYQDGWPDVNDIKAHLKFAGRSMVIISNHGKTLGANINFAEAKINNLDKAILAIKGQIKTFPHQKVHLDNSNNPLLKFLHNECLNNLNIFGKWQLGLNLQLPLDKDLRMNPKVRGLIKLDKTDIVANEFLPLTNLTGKLFFSEETAKASRITGKLFAKPFQLKMVSKTSRDSKSTQMDWKGSIAVTDIKKLTDFKVLDYLQGTTKVHARLSIFKDMLGKVKKSLIIESDLLGVESNLPPPFTKVTKTILPSLFTLEQRENDSQLLFMIADRMNGVIDFKKKQNHLELERGDVQLGNQKAQLHTSSGLKVQGNLTEFDWAHWKPIINEFKRVSIHQSVTEAVRKFQRVIGQIDINISKLKIANLLLDSTHLQIFPKNNDLTILVASNPLQGEINFPTLFPQLPIKVMIQSLSLTGKDTLGNNLLPQNIPPMDLRIANFHYKDKLFKNLDLKLRKENKTLLIKQIKIQDRAVEMSASGIWREINGHHETSLNGSFDSNNVGATLNQWQITDNMVKGKGGGNFNLTWLNSPFNLESKTLNGSIALRFNEGRIIKLSNKANFGMDMGRVLTLFSLQTLQRRLHLDFSDLTEPGFSFDEMKGVFQLRQGNVFTDDASLDGPVAKVRIQGRIGLAGKDYDLRLAVSPNVTSSLPVVATLTAGPLVGAVTWLADKVFSHQVKKITEIHYNVTGTWDQPKLKNLFETIN